MAFSYRSQKSIMYDICPVAQQNDTLLSDIHLKIEHQQLVPGCSQVTINELPDELMLMIFSHFNFGELINVQNVCTRWKRLANDAHLWHDKVYEIGNEKTDEDAIETLKMTPQLNAVIVKRSAQPSLFRALADNCHQIVMLDIAMWQILSFSDVQNLFKSCNKVQVLRIPKRFLTDTRFPEALAHLKDLQALQLKAYLSSDSTFQLRELAHTLPRLSEINLETMCYTFDDLEYFIRAKQYSLKSIGLMWASHTGRCVVPLLTLCAGCLEHLHLYYVECGGLADEGFIALCQLKNLKELVMNNVEGPVDNLFPLPFRSGSLSKLQLLQFCGPAINDETILAVSHGCPNLCELVLHSCTSITDAGFILFHQLTQLKTLSITSCRRLCGELIPQIAKLPSLRRLKLDYIKLERLQPGLQHILLMSNLRSLHLRGCTVKDMPFDKFPGNLVSLRELHLDYCEGSESILHQMCAKMCELKVYGKLSEQLLFTDSEDEDEDYDEDYLADYELNEEEELMNEAAEVEKVVMEEVDDGHKAKRRR